MRAYSFWITLSEMSDDRLEHCALHLNWELCEFHNLGWMFNMRTFFLHCGFVTNVDEFAGMRSWTG